MFNGLKNCQKKNLIGSQIFQINQERGKKQANFLTFKALEN